MLKWFYSICFTLSKYCISEFFEFRPMKAKTSPGQAIYLPNFSSYLFGCGNSQIQSNRMSNQIGIGSDVHLIESDFPNLSRSLVSVQIMLNWNVPNISTNQIYVYLVNTLTNIQRKCLIENSAPNVCWIQTIMAQNYMQMMKSSLLRWTTVITIHFETLLDVYFEDATTEMKSIDDFVTFVDCYHTVWIHYRNATTTHHYLQYISKYRTETCK